MKRYLPFAIIVIAGAAAITGGTIFYRMKVAELAPGAGNISEQKSGASSPHIRGEANAPITLEEFGDFQCPPCADLWLVLTTIERDYGAKLKVIFREYPLQMHKYADLAARAAEAAGKQDRFWEMHDLLYRNQSIWSSSTAVEGIFNKYAFNIGLDLERYKADLTSEEVRVRILADQERANSLGVKSTPTLLLNNNLLPPGSVSEPGLRAAIENVLKGKPPTSAASPTSSP